MSVSTTGSEHISGEPLTESLGDLPGDLAGDMTAGLPDELLSPGSGSTSTKVEPGPHHLHLLKILQSTLQSQYDIFVPYCVSDFICVDEAHLRALSGQSKSTAPEILFYREDGDDFELSLFLNSTLLKQIDDQHFSAQWSGRGLDDCSILLEGVSHFLYLVWNAHHDRQVSLLDLELQAEVDKFVFAALETDWGKSPAELHQRLFSNIGYRYELPPELRARYEKANSIAASYCHWLLDEFSLKHPNRALTAELARFYRLNGAAKQDHVALK